MVQDIDDISKLNRVEVLLSCLISDDVDFVSSAMMQFGYVKQQKIGS